MTTPFDRLTAKGDVTFGTSGTKKGWEKDVYGTYIIVGENTYAPFPLELISLYWDSSTNLVNVVLDATGVEGEVNEFSVTDVVLGDAKVKMKFDSGSTFVSKETLDDPFSEATQFAAIAGTVLKDIKSPNFMEAPLFTS